MKKIHINKEGWIIISLFLLTILVRMIFKNGGVFHWDSLKDVMVIEEMIKTGSMQYSYAYGAPGMVAFVSIFYWMDKVLFGATSAEPAYFFVTFLTTALSVVLIYILTKKITRSQFASITASLFFSFNAIILTVTTYPKTHSIALFFILLSFYFILLYNKTKKSKYIWLSGLLFGLSVSVRIMNALLFIPLLFLYFNPKIKNRLLIFKKNKLKLRNFLYLIISAFGIWYILFAKRISEWGGFFQYLSRLLGEQGSAVRWQGLFSDSLRYSISQIYISISIVGAILFFIGLYYGIIKYRKTLIFLLLWLLPPFLYFANIDQPLSRFFIVFIPAISIIMAMGNLFVYRKNKMIGIIVAAIVIISMFYVAYPIIQHRHEYSGTKELALWVAENTEENAVIMTNDLGHFIEYYGKRARIVHPRTGKDEDIQVFMQKLTNYSNQGIPIYSTGEGFAIDPGQKVLAAIQQEYNIEGIGEKEGEIYQFSDLQLAPYNEALFKLTKK